MGEPQASRRARLVPWVVSVVGAAVVVAPQLLLDRHWQERRAVWAIVAVFIVNVATLCLLLRFVVFLTDFFRRPRREHA